MTNSPNRRTDQDNLPELELCPDSCLARDVPALRQQLRALRTLERRGQPVDQAAGRLERALRASQRRVDRRRAGLPVPSFSQALPIVEHRDAIAESIAAHQVLVLCGETGSGKTTQLPKLCLHLGRGTRGKIGHTQPRRIAARTLAARIAEELGCAPGTAVGHKIRFQDRVQDSSYVKVMTDGILLAEIQSDPELREYDTLILDEAHERSLNIDFLLGYLHRLLPRRPDLKLIITSATIDPQRFAAHFDNAPVIEVSGRTWPVEIRYRPLQGEDEDQQQRSREQAIVDAVDELVAEGPGDILVFLPGERAIRETGDSLRKRQLRQTEILPLYARLSTQQQNSIFKPHQGRRIVLATNVAETSLTVPGIRYVIDTGLVRTSRYNYRTKVQRLPIEAISQASANQRAGRCGRVAAGVCIRLYREQDYLAREAFTTPEIHRTSLAAVILRMATQGLGDVEAFPFIDPPDPRYIRDGYKLLYELDAVDRGHRVTPLGRKLARIPVDPRLGRMLLTAHDKCCLTELLVIVAALESADPRERPLEKTQAADAKHAVFADRRSDFLSFLNLWRAFTEQAARLSQNKLRAWCREHFISYTRMREWDDVHRQLQAQVKTMGLSVNDTDADYQAIHEALLTGLVGNVAYQAEPGEYVGARNLKLALFPGSALSRKKPRWLVAGELVETSRRYLRTAAAIEPGWLEQLVPHLVKRNYVEPHWEKKRAQVVAFENVTLYGLPLVQRRRINFGRIDPAVSRELFIRHALVNGEWQRREEFVLHNRGLLQELEELEAKSRRRDLIVDEQHLYAFFDARVPATVFDVSTFLRWWKTAGREQPELLHLRRDELMQHTADAVTDQQFPDHLSVRGTRFEVDYDFAPGSDRDGLRVRVPLVALNQLQADDFDWLVPGMVEEKCTLLIKSLPKSLRRNFVPAPDFARACLEGAETSSGNLCHFLAARLQRISGIDVPVETWRPELLPAHLFATFEIVDERAGVLGEGRDLSALKQRLGTRAQQDFAGLGDTRFERRDLQGWDVGTVPESVELERDGVRLLGYPALSVTEQHIDLRVFDQPDVARAAHREGLLALFRKSCARLVRDIGRAVPDLDKQELYFSPVAGPGVLRADLERAVLQAAFLLDGEPVRDEAGFRQRLVTGREQLLAKAVEIGTWTGDALQAYQQLQRVLKGAVPPALLAAVDDVGQQVEHLVYPGFVSATPLQWLPHLTRYLRAADRRLQQASSNLARDRDQAQLVAGYWQRYREAVERGAAGAPGAELIEFRWMVEELRVSLFAQSLGTAEKVSPQRLDRLWAAIPAGGVSR